MADHVAKDCVEKIKHLSRGTVSARSVAELLPESLHFAAVHVGLLRQLAEFNDEWDKVNEECLRGMKIENSNDPGIDRFYGKFVMGLRSKESRIADERKWIIKILLSSKQPPLDDSEKPFEEKESSRVEEDVKEMEKREKKATDDSSKHFELAQKDAEHNASPDTELGDSVNVDKMEKLITKVGILDEHLEHKSQIENGDKKKCLEEKKDETDESIGENGVEGISVIYSKHIDDDEYEKRFQTDIEKAVCQSLGSLKKHYGLLLSMDETTTSRLDVHLYVIIQSQWRLRLFRDELMSRSEKKHTHAGDPCFVCAYSDTYAAIRIATKELPRKVVVPFSSITLRPVYDFFKEWLNLENPVDDAEMGVSTSDYELKRHLVTVVWFVLSSVSYRNEDLHFLPIIYDINNFDFDSTQCSTDESILELSGHVMPVC
ncbi:hypothetical protein QYF36_004361 [Acer negundo]|nr:hypothetical protein QYF36_004361 [Acer negundo]